MPTKVFVGNLPEDITVDTLRDIFEPYGDILNEVAVVKNFAFVHFLTENDAKNAVHDLHQTKIRGKNIIVEISSNQSFRSSKGDARSERHDGPRRDFDNRGPNNNASFQGGILGGASFQGGILGGAPPPLMQNNFAGPLGIFPPNNINALVALEEQARLRNSERIEEQTRLRNLERMGPSPRRSPPPSFNRDSRDTVEEQPRNKPESRSQEGYVIYERFYVDPNHPLLTGLPLPKLPRMTDSFVAPRDSSQSTHSISRDNRRRSPSPARAHVNAYRERSPQRRNDLSWRSSEVPSLHRENERRNDMPLNSEYYGRGL